MRLKEIKLAGFKSFVDPTTIVVPGQLVGIVGPNGCGKSNVIDAVRWVMGESSAKQLRGETMADVIFNGSSNRKPSGRASVELVFENTMGRLTGLWSQYAELSIKRIVTRDGDSSYYINNQHVRRRDITDIFLGTGLGPRAYSIIEQGMISRIVTAKPEEVRLFLEEAAGVSKYRERRRETELRLEDSRGNLARVADILSELDKQVEKLAKQAEIAAKYQELTQNLTETQHLLAFTKAREAGDTKNKVAAEIVKAEGNIGAESAKLTEIDAALTQLRETHYADTDRLANLQGSLYEANAFVAGIEREITYLTDTRARLGEQLASVTGEISLVALQVEQAEADRGHWHSELAVALEKIEVAKLTADEKRAAVPEAEAAIERARGMAREVEALLKQFEQSQRIDEMKEGQALKNLSQLEGRKNRLRTEMMGLPTPSEEELAELDLIGAEATERAMQLEAEEQSAEHSIPEMEALRRTAATDSQQLAREVAAREAQLLQLEKLQAKADSNNTVGLWAAKHGLDKAPKLFDALRVEPGWEDAVEAALGQSLKAHQALDGAHLAAINNDPPAGAFAAYVAGQAPPVNEQGQRQGLISLVSKVTVQVPAAAAFLHQLLMHYFACDDAPSAVDRAAQVAQLPAGAVLITRAGHTFSAQGSVFYGPSDTNRELHGVLQRSREIEQLKGDIPAKQAAKQVLDQHTSALDGQLNAARETVKRVRQQLTLAKSRAHEVELKASKLRQAMEAALQRKGQIKAELGQIEADEAHEREAITLAQEALEESALSMEGTLEKLDTADRSTRTAQAQLTAVRDAANAADREAQAAHYQEKSCHDKIQSLTRLAQTMGERLTALTSNQAQLSTQLAEVQEGNARERLQAAQASKGEREKALTEGRRGMEALTDQLRSLDEQRLSVEQSLGPLNQRINDLRFKEQEARITEENFKAQLTEAGAVWDNLVVLIEKKQRSSSFQAEINRLQADITALGAVNLAALDELNASKERKDYLDKQCADLLEAVATLESAIKRIDKETRDLLQTTYDQVNKNFSELFPALFGGGQAYLKLTGEEILDAGIQVFAQPPGKKNTSIQLLSGGEKALSALSLVFALFKLNPAPFCMLDEVDAPLDDTNTGRYVDLVRKMSEHTQFLFITHSKITMELARQLVGVTMAEPGVSRIVEVDVEAALEFTAA